MLARRKKQPDNLMRSPADRYPSGNKRESIAPAVVYRMREHGVKLGMDPRLGTVLGVMGLHKQLSDAEVAAGFKCAEIIGRYERLKGIPRRSSASPSYQRGFGSGDIMDEARLTPDQVKSHQRLVRRATKAYDKLLTMFPTEKARALVERVCCDNEHISPLLLPSLAACLLDLARKWEMVPAVKPKAAAPKITPDDILLMANGCVEALQQWAAFEKVKITTFEIVAKSQFARERGITVTDGKVSHTVMIPRKSINSLLLDSALRAQALNAGWTEADAETGEVE